MSTSELRLLVVDDDPDDVLLFRECVREAVRDVPLHVEDASTPAQALELLAGRHYDVIVIDYRLGPESGIDLLRTIRSRGIDHPVILLAGVGDEQVAVEAMKAGAMDYIVKSALTPSSIGSAIRYAVEVTLKEAQRLHAEAALRDAETRYRILFEQSPYGVLLVDLDAGRAIEMNDVAYKQLGYTREEFAALRISDYEASEKPEETAEHMQKIVREGSDEFETLHRTKSGEIRNVHVWAKTLPFDDRILFYAIFQDITERKRTDDALRASEERFRTLYENSTVGIYRTTPEGRILLANPALVKMLGFTTFDALANRELNQEGYAPSNPRSQFTDLINAEGEVRGLESAWTRKDGTTVLVRESVRAISDAQGNKLYYDGVVEDITERKRAEASLHLQSAALNAAADAITITDRLGVIEWVNPSFTRLTGYTAAEAIGQNPRLIKSGKHDPAFYRSLWKTLLSGQVWNGEIINRRKDGSRYTGQQSITPILDRSGVITHFVSIQEDITERLQLQSQLLQSQKMESVGQLAGGVAHDFNNLLTAILGYSHVVSEELGKGHALYADLEQVRIAGERAASLTRQLLVFSRKQVLVSEIVNLNTVATETDKMLRRIIGEDIELSIVLDPKLGCVMIDPTQVEQVIMNLCVNARDAMPTGGKLTIETLNVDLDESYAQDHAHVHPGSYVLLAVSDTGVGMDEETKSHVFEPFFTTKELGKGTGLGLATVYGIVNQSGGHIWIYSELGKGTTFKIYFPLVEERGELSQAPGRAKPTVIGGSETILLVEDDETIRHLVGSILRGYGYDVIEALTPQTALATAAQRTEPIRLLVTDVVMPGMSGPELASRVANLQSGIRVLYMSGYADEAVVRHGLTEAGTAFLQKPFSPEALLEKVRAVLNAPPA